MVRAIPINPWHWTDVLERVRPGIAVSATLHIGLFFILAYYLAFRPQLQVPAPPPDEVMQYVEAPKPPPAAIEIPKVPTFKSIVTRPIKGVDFKVRSFVLPPFEGTNNGPPQTTTTAEPPALAIIKDPTPVYRGGLIYPDRAADMGREGYVDFEFIIEPDGTVGDPHVVAEVPDGIGFAEAAKKAFPKWRFNPMMKDGRPVAAPARIRVSFKLK